MRKDPTQAIIILGGGAVGLLSVLAIKKRNLALKIKVVRSSEIGSIDDGGMIEFFGNNCFLWSQ